MSHLRLHQHTRQEVGTVCDADKLYEHYVSDCNAAEAPHVSPVSFKQTVSKLFNMKTTKTTINRSSIHIFKGLQYFKSGPQPQGDHDVADGRHSDTNENIDLPEPWFVVRKSGANMTVGLKCDVRFFGVFLTKEVHIDTDRNVSISVGQHKLKPTTIGLPANLKECCMSLSNFLQVVHQVKLCTGKEVPRGTIDAVPCNINNLETFRKFSKSCSHILPVLARGAICRNCHSVKIDSHSDSDSDSDHPLESDDTSDSPEDTFQYEDPTDLLHKVFPNANNKLFKFLLSQSKNCLDEVAGKDKRQRKWDEDVLSFALTIWIASPVAYRILHDFMHLPSERLLQMYKNGFDKNPGINHNMIQWMYEECDRTGTEKEGGLIFDEMNIQPGVQLEPQGEGLRMFGYVDFGRYNNGLQQTTSQGKPLQLATCVLQFVFLAYNGFRFPFCYVLANGLCTAQLVSLFWDIVNTLKSYDFRITYICMDGAAINRSFINEISDTTTALAKNICTLSSQIACIMDFSHAVKKIRNSISSSGQQAYHTRNLTTPKGFIYWRYFVDAYEWDKRSNYLRIHRKLTNDHFHLNSTLKMRNHLAEHVLNRDMSYLFHKYQKTLEYPDTLNAVIQLLSFTSLFIDIYRSAEPVSSMQDERLSQLQTVLAYFDEWDAFCKRKRGHKKVKNDIFITMECYTDLKYCINGIISLCHEVVPRRQIIPRLVNSDVCENIFCQQRASYNGANSNPDASQYRYDIYIFCIFILLIINTIMIY